jgi:hypothetical protein
MSTMGRPTRFHNWPRRARLGLLALTAILVVWGLAAGSGIPSDYTTNDPATSDVKLYEAIVDRMQDGASYYTAVGIEQPARGFPVSPAMAVREPTLAWVSSWVGLGPMYALLVALGALVVLVMVWRIGQLAGGRAAWLGGCLLMGGSVVVILGAQESQMHEFWAAFLLMLSIAVRSDRHWMGSVVLGLLAAMVRELCIPYLVVMGVLALREQRRREAVGWFGASGLFAAFYAWHAHEVSTRLSGAGEASKGWADIAGWPFTVDAISFASILQPLPYGIAAVLVPLALLGWASRTGSLATRVTAVLATFAVAFGIAARHDNAYWGLLLAALFIVGLAFAPSALVDLVRRPAVVRSRA